MIIDEEIKDEKLQYRINREAARILALSTGKIDKYEFRTGEEILASDQSVIIEWSKFTYSSLGKALEKQIKTTENQGIKQVEALKALKPEESQILESIEGVFTKKIKNNETKYEMITLNEKKKLNEKI